MAPVLVLSSSASTRCHKYAVTHVCGTCGGGAAGSGPVPVSAGHLQCMDNWLHSSSIIQSRVGGGRGEQDRDSRMLLTSWTMQCYIDQIMGGAWNCRVLEAQLLLHSRTFTHWAEVFTLPMRNCAAILKIRSR